VFSDALLLLAALIWGVAFVPQRTAMEHIGPFFFTATRFALGAVVLLPLLALWRNGPANGAAPVVARPRLGLWTGGVVTGVFLFIAISLQQWGIVYTTAGKAGFISGLYVVVVALLGLLWGQRVAMLTWMGAGAAMFGLYLLAVPQDMSINRGDVLVFASIFAWAGQIQMIGYLTGHVRVIPLAIVQFTTCAVLSLLAAVVFEPIALSAVTASAGQILYTGVLSAGVAYTLQIAGQRGAPPTHAAIIMSLETVFAAVAGWLILNELLGPRALVGCGLMLAGMLMSQLAAMQRRPWREVLQRKPS
jgi:drug/metabolite transporter (DMT)-like permease